MIYSKRKSKHLRFVVERPCVFRKKTYGSLISAILFACISITEGKKGDFSVSTLPF